MLLPRLFNPELDCECFFPEKLGLNLMNLFRQAQLALFWDTVREMISAL